jgi:prepilin-type N-terminal cleavage/methylation domain-containing protein
MASSLYHQHLKKLMPATNLRGFGLIELMVSIAIMTLVSVVILVNHNSFNGAVLLRNQAYEIAFALRQAQLLAVSGTEAVTSDAPRYGVYFSPGAATYQVFHDKNDNGTWDSAPTDAAVGQLGRLDSRFVIRDVTDNSGTPLTTNLAVTFKRPNFDGIFIDGTTPTQLVDNDGDGTPDSSVYIDIGKVKGPTQGSQTYIDVGNVRRVEVLSTGQISVVTY